VVCVKRGVIALLVLGLFAPALAGCLDNGESIDYHVCVDEPWPEPTGALYGDDAALPYGVGYATGLDRTLLRWFYDPRGDPEDDPGLPADAVFRVFRAAGADPDPGDWQHLDDVVPGVDPAMDPAQAIAILDETDDRWDDLSGFLLEVLDNDVFRARDFGEVLELLDAEPAIGSLIGDRYYPVALLMGDAYLDTDPLVQDALYSYRVVYQGGGDEIVLGEVLTEAGRFTPLGAPVDLECVELGPGSTLRQGHFTTDLRMSERNYHQKVMLRWDPPEVPSDASAEMALRLEGAWENGYDVYRAPKPDPMPDSVLELGFVHLNGDSPVYPMPMHDLRLREVGNAPVVYDYLDETPEPGEWVYAVAPRDLLGQQMQATLNPEGFTDPPVVATSYDTTPPPAPIRLDVEQEHDAAEPGLRLVWELPDDEVFEAAGVEGPVEVMVQRTRDHQALPPGPEPCRAQADEESCWMPVAGGLTGGEWLDTDVEPGVLYWYRVFTMDSGREHPPLSIPVGPQKGILRDLDPPEPPLVEWVDRDLELQRLPPGGTPPAPATIVLQPAMDDEGETVRYRVECRFGEGDWHIIAEVERLGDPGIRMTSEVELRRYYSPPVMEPVPECTARAVDKQGNVSPQGDVVLVPDFATTQTLPQPILVHAGPVPDSDEGDTEGPADDPTDAPADEPTDAPVDPGTGLDPGLGVGQGQSPMMPVVLGSPVKLEWVFPSVGAALQGFEVERRDLQTDEAIVETVPPRGRSYEDFTAKDGGLYEYTVTAVGVDGQRVASEPRRVDVHEVRPDDELDRAVRSLANIDWEEGAPFLNADHTAGLQWHCPLCDTRVDPDDRGFLGGPFAVYRSSDPEEGYIQVTPIMEMQRFSDQPFWYHDESAFDGAWYVVVGFDSRTGEPMASSQPAQVVRDDGPLPVDWDAVPLAQSVSFLDHPCDGEAVDQGQPIRFAMGAEMVVAEGWASQDPQGLMGGGTLVLPDVLGGGSVNANFQDLRVRHGPGPANQVCQGRIDVDLPEPRELGNSGVVVHNARFGPFAAPLVGDAVVPVYGARVQQADGSVLAGLPLRNAVVTQDGSVSYQAHLSASQQSCDEPAFRFLLDTLPLHVVPRGSFQIAGGVFEMGDACVAYEDPYLGEDDPSSDFMGDPLPGHPMALLAWGDNNDGYLRTSFQAQGPVTLDAQGFNMDLSSDLPEGPLDYMAAAPFGFRVQISGAVELEVRDSRITGGQVTGVSGVTSWHYTWFEPMGGARSSFYSFDVGTMEVLTDGALYAQGVPFNEAVSWTNRHLLHAHDDWELLLGRVTLDDVVARTLTGYHEDRPLVVAGFGQTLPVPGLNLRSESAQLTWDCGDPVLFDVHTDLYLRRGGVSDLVRAQVAEVAFDLYGYDAGLVAWGRGFLDNMGTASDVAGAVDLPFPVGSLLELDPMSLDADGCINGGGSQDETMLDYWHLNATIDAAEFRDAPPGVDAGEKLLWALGEYHVPHLQHPEDPERGLYAEAAFLPSGDFHASRAIYDQVEYRMDGFPYLVERFRLSDVGELPLWDPLGSARELPGMDGLLADADHWQEGGFLALQGLLFTPYYGALTSAHGSPPEVIVSLGEDTQGDAGPTIGFAPQARAERVWADVSDAQLVWGYDLVYAQDLAGGQSRFIGYDSHEFLPLGLLRDVLERPVDRVDAVLGEAEDSLVSRVSQANLLVEETFDGIDAKRAQAMGQLESWFLEELTDAEAAVIALVVDAFADARESVQALGPDGDGPTTRQERLDQMHAQLDSVLLSAQGLSEDAVGRVAQWDAGKSARLASLSQALDNATRLLERYEVVAEAAWRSTADIEARLERLVDYTQNLELPFEFPSIVDEESLWMVSDETMESIQVLQERGSDKTQELLSAALGGFSGVPDRLEETLERVQSVRKGLNESLQRAGELKDGTVGVIERVQATIEAVDNASSEYFVLAGAALSNITQAVEDARGDLQLAVDDEIEHEGEGYRQSFINEVTLRLEDAQDEVEGRVDSVFASTVHRVMGVVQEADAEMAGLIGSAEVQVLSLLDLVEDALVVPAAEARASVRVHLEGLTGRVLDLAEPLRVVHLDSAAIVEPEELDVYLGLAAAPAAGIGVAGPLGRTDRPWAAVQQEMSTWADGLGVPEDPDHRGLIQAVWVNGDDLDEVANVPDALEAWIEEPGALAGPLDNRSLGGGTGGLLLSEESGRGLDVNRTRGQVLLEDDGAGGLQMESFGLVAQGRVGSPDDPVLDVALISVEIDRHGVFTLVVEGATGRVLFDEDVELDATAVIDVSAPSVEGGVTLWGLETEHVDIHQATAALGIGPPDLLYLGASFDGTFETVGSVDVGGSLLVGRIDTTSPVLQNHFPDVMDHIQAVDGFDGTPMTGIYLRAYGGPIPVLDFSCPLRVNVEAEVGFWYFTGDEARTAGALLGGAVQGDLLCVITAYGQVSIMLSRTTVDGEAVTIGSGEAFVVGGIGKCSPETWGHWNDRWWDERRRCMLGGGYVDITYHSDRGFGGDRDIDKKSFGRSG
jgi:hypothetical protein